MLNLPAFCPTPPKKLRHTVDLVVILAHGEGNDLVTKCLQPFSLRRNIHMALFDCEGLRFHAHYLVVQFRKAVHYQPVTFA